MGCNSIGYLWLVIKKYFMWLLISSYWFNQTIV